MYDPLERGLRTSHTGSQLLNFFIIILNKEGQRAYHGAFQTGIPERRRVKLGDGLRGPIANGQSLIVSWIPRAAPRAICGAHCAILCREKKVIVKLRSLLQNRSVVK